MSTPLSTFDAAAAELRRQEFARLTDYVPPPLTALRSMTPHALRNEVAVMLERLDYAIINDPTAQDLIVTKGGQKFVVMCQPPADKEPTRTDAVAHVHDAVVAASAEAGFCITTRAFTAAARNYAATIPVRLVDGEKLAASMKKSKGDAVLPDTYKAMCCQCGDTVRHRLDSAEPLPCINGHRVPPTIARAAIVRQEIVPDPVNLSGPRPKQALSQRAKIHQHNARVKSRALKRQRDSGR